MIRARLIRSSPAISKSNRFPVVLSCYLIATRLFRNPTHYSKSFSTDSPVGPFVGSDGHIVRVVNRKGNTCRQARVHWLLASLVRYYSVAGARPITLNFRRSGAVLQFRRPRHLSPAACSALPRDSVERL